MNGLITRIDEDGDLKASHQSDDGGRSWVRSIWEGVPDGQVRIAVWKAEPGVYGSTGRVYAETFVVSEGMADCTIGDAPMISIAPGSIVHIPAGVAIVLEVKTPFRKLAVAVMDGAAGS